MARRFVPGSKDTGDVRSTTVRILSSVLTPALTILLSFQAAHAFDAPPGFDGFQFAPPYTTANPFLGQELGAIDRGFAAFTTETFDGNGRTCSTCHLPEKNYNVTADDIAAMTPGDKAKVLATNNPDLENQEIVETLGLFNIDQAFGADSAGDLASPEGPFRASMSIGGIGFSTLNNFVCRVDTPSPGGTPCTRPGGLPGNNRVDDGIRDIMIGWSGEGPLVEMFGYTGAPVTAAADCASVIDDFAGDLTNLDKALATFALAAVKTHFPLSQNRVPGVDFRCPTADELLDMAKFQKWLGRRFELDIRKLAFTSPEAKEGLLLFSSEAASCVGCHVNAGGSDTQGRVKLFPVPFLPDEDDNGGEDEPLEVIGANKTSRNGTQFLEPGLDALVTANFPFDEGDGELRSGGTQGGFNVQSIIEATRKTRFFHNSAVVGTIEDAIAHYFTDDFDSSQGGNAIKGAFRDDKAGPVVLDELGGVAAINKIGYFLRHLSAVYSLADCERLVDEMIDRTALGMSTDLPFTHCQFAMTDVQFVLEGVQINTSLTDTQILNELTQIEALLAAAQQETNPTVRTNALTEIASRLRRLRNAIASTEEVQDRVASAPALSVQASGLLALGLLGVAVVALRRREARAS